MSNAALDALFKPFSIALIGASEKVGSFNAGRTSLLLNYFQGRLHLVHPTRQSIMGREVFKSINDIPEEIDLAIVMTPAAQTLEVLEQCGRKGVKAVQVLSGGFDGIDGKSLGEKMLASAIRWNMRIAGPNCIGTFSPSVGLTIAEGAAMQPGHVGIISQSGGLAIDFAVRGSGMGLRFSQIVSIGNCMDLGHADYLQWFANDPKTKVLGIYLESVKDGRAFFHALKKATANKQVVILKGGRTTSGAKAAASHTGGLAGEYAVWRAAIRQAGAIEAHSAEDLLHTLLICQSFQPCEGGIAMLGNGGGATVLATDCCLEEGLQFVRVSETAKEQLFSCSTAISPHNMNPIDLNAMELAKQGVFGRILRVFANERDTAAIIFHLNLISFMSQGDFSAFAQTIAHDAQEVSAQKVNICAVLRYSGNLQVEKIRSSLSAMLTDAGIPVFITLNDALHAIALSGRVSTKKGNVA